MTAPHSTAYAIRPFQESDRAAVVEIRNQDMPRHRHGSAASWKRRDQLRKPELVDLRFCAVDPQTDQIFGFLSAVDLNTATWKMDDVCDYGVSVDHAHEGEGISSAFL